MHSLKSVETESGWGFVGGCRLAGEISRGGRASDRSHALDGSRDDRRGPRERVATVQRGRSLLLRAPADQGSRVRCEPTVYRQALEVTICLLASRSLL